MFRTLVPRSPRTNLRGFHEEVDNLIDNFFGNGENGGQLQTFAPRTNISETKDAFEVTVDLPGMKAEDVDVSIEDGVLSITGERTHEEETKEKHFHRVERSYGKFQRAFTLTAPVEEDQVQAAYKDGVLTITLPKSEKAKPRQISVNVN